MKILKLSLKSYSERYFSELFRGQVLGRIAMFEF